MENQRLIIESIPSIKEGRIAEGIAVLPGISGNGWWYERNTVKSARPLNVALPVHWDHDTSTIGTVTYSLDESIPMIKYRLEITSPYHKLVEGVHRVSIDAQATSFTNDCATGNCYKKLDGIILEGISITTHPSVIGSSLNVINESLSEWNKITEAEQTTTENDNLKKLEEKINQLETELQKATTCKSCGKHKSFS